MAVYAGTSAEHLDAALGSVAHQTRPADEIVLVVDGPISTDHEVVLAGYRGTVTRLDLPHNVGLGRALQAGLERCSGDWIARADADDVNSADRFERQLAILEGTGADVCSSSMTEVAGPSMRELGVRRTPTTHREFARRMRIANPVNHPSVMFRRARALQAGGYQHLPFLEDYDLWARMLRDGARFVGIEQPLVEFRTDGMLARRSNRSVKRSEQELQQRLRTYGLVSWPRAHLNRLVRASFRRLPAPLQGHAYAAIFRRRKGLVTRARPMNQSRKRAVGLMSTTGAVCAALGWLTLLLVARFDDPGSYAAVAVLWAVYYVAAGALSGLQQEATRALVVGGNPMGSANDLKEPGHRHGWSLLEISVVLGVVTALLVTATFPWWRGPLDAEWPILIPLALGNVTLAALILMLGVLSAQDRWGTAAALLLGDAIVRLVCTGLVAAMDGSRFWYAAAIVSGSLVWIPVLLSKRRSVPRLALAHRDPHLLPRVMSAVAAAAGASLLIAGMPWLYALTLRESSEQLSAGMLAGLVLFRSPVLVLAQGFRPVVLRELVSEGSDASRHMRRAFRGYALAAVVAVAFSYAIGPDVLRLTFGDAYDVTAQAAAILALSAVLLALAAHLTVALVAAARHRRGTEGWLAAVVATLLVLVLPIADSTRLLWAAIAGPAIGVAYLSTSWARVANRN